LFPGYLFLLFEKNTNPETEEKIIHAIDELRFKNCGLIKIISDPITLKPLPLTKKDLMLLDKLLNSNDLVDYTIGLHIGDQIRIISGPFVGMESKIIKFNKRKYRLKVKLDFLGVNEIDLPYTYIEPINQ
jgi:transcription antitermination factor NusG